MMIDSVYREPELNGIICNFISEEGVEVIIGSSLLDKNDDLDSDSIVILKADGYYNTVRFAAPPKCADNVVVVYDGVGYTLYVIELKSTKKPCRIDRDQIVDKFATIFDRFFVQDFDHIFNSGVSWEDVHAWLVCDPLRVSGKNITPEVYHRKVKSSALDFFSTVRPFKYNGKYVSIKPMLPGLVIEKNGYADIFSV